MRKGEGYDIYVRWNGEEWTATLTKFTHAEPNDLDMFKFEMLTDRAPHPSISVVINECRNHLLNVELRQP